MVVVNIPRPSRRTSIVAVALLALLSSAYLVGNTFMLNKGQPITLSGLGYSGSETSLTVTPTSSAGDAATAAAAAAVAASAAVDAAKAASGSPLRVYFDMVATGDGGELEVGEAAELLAERLVVFTARVELEVEDVETAVGEVRLLAERHGGFVSTEQTRSESGVITIRVPQRVFHDAVAEVEELGEVKGRDLKGEDVTEEYVDLGSQLVNLENQEKRLLEIMGMGTTVESVLRVEKELERVRGSIESIKGRMNYLESRVELATITVLLNLEEAEPEVQTAWFPDVDWSAPVKAGLSILFSIAQGMIAMVIVVGPFAALGYAGLRGYRHLRFRKTSSVEGDTPIDESSSTS
jgi:hypothetical protein